MPKRKRRAKTDDVPALADQGHERAGLRLVARAIRGGWDVPAELKSKLPRVVVGLVANARNDREKLRAVEVLVAMERDNMAALVAADKVERLDNLQPTELVTLLPITLKAGGQGA